MGRFLKAICSCGLSSEVMMQGLGFGYFETGNFYEPAYCDTCGIVVERNASKSYSKCPGCRKKVTFYNSILNDRKSITGEPAFSKYLEKKDFWHCPKCHHKKLQFESMGSWD